MHLDLEEDLKWRAGVLTVVFTLVFAALVFRLGFLQIVEGEKWEEISQGQRVRLVASPAPRGNIHDRNGLLLATNKPAFTVSLVYTGKPLADDTVARLSGILDIAPEDIRASAARLKPASGRPYEHVPLKVDINDREHVLLEEFRHELPGVVVDVQPLREYPGLVEFGEIEGRLAAHVLGQVKKADLGPSAVGVDGLEAAYNGNPEAAEESPALLLQGKDGWRQIEVDAQGRPLGGAVREQPPVPGNNLVLTLDARLQAVAEQALLDRMRYLREMRAKPCTSGCAAEYGAAVVIDVRTGEILALASAPAYDPNKFALRAAAMPGTPLAGEFNNVTWKALQEDPGKPLMNHATMNYAPPGSAFKPITALAALEEGVTNPRLRVPCPGYRQVGDTRFEDWRPHGSTNLEQALGRSCNVYFYEMGSRLKNDALATMAGRFGLGEKTGLEARDGIREVGGWVASPETKRRLNPDEPWYPSENLSAAIGQADNRFTALQMANFTATLANGGTRYRPYLVKSIAAPDGTDIRRFKPEVMGRAEVDPEHLREVTRGMLAVSRYNPHWTGGVDSLYGTAVGSFADFPQKTKEMLGREIMVASKTGTAETGIRGESAYGWFIAFAPYDKPEIALAVFIRHGGGGSLAAAPVARSILDEYFGLNRVLAESRQIRQKRTGPAIY